MKKLFSVVLAGLLMLLGTNAFAQYSFGGGYTQFVFSGKDAPKIMTACLDSISVPTMMLHSQPLKALLSSQEYIISIMARK